MKKVLCLAFAAFTTIAFGDPPPPTIDVKNLPAPAKMIDEVVVPVPSEIFGVLDKIGSPKWAAVQNKKASSAKPIGDPAQVALVLGTVIAEGFIAVEAKDSAEVQKIGKCVLTLSTALGVSKSVTPRANSIIAAAKKDDWITVRKELDNTLREVKKAMEELKSEQLSQLVSLGGWIRGTEALTEVVKTTYTKDGAELLHQPVLIDYFDKQIANMDKKVKANSLVIKVQKGLADIRPLIGIADGTEISEKSVKEVGDIAGGLIKAINTKAQ